MARDLREEWTLQRDLSQGHSGAERRTARTQSGGDGGGGPPLPIPNRAVKPASADGTARKGGRVGYRRCSRGSDRRAMSSDAAPLFLCPSLRHDCPVRSVSPWTEWRNCVRIYPCTSRKVRTVWLPRPREWERPTAYGAGGISRTELLRSSYMSGYSCG